MSQPDGIPAAESLLAMAGSAVPGLVVDDVEVMTNGWDNMVLKVNNALVFRFRRGRPMLGLGLDTELSLLSALAGKTRMGIPRVAAHDFSVAFPYIVYPLLPGGWMPLQLTGRPRDGVVADISGFMADVHAGIPWQRAMSFGVEAAQPADTINVDTALGLVADRDLRELIQNAVAVEASASMDVDDRVFLHNDVHHRNVAWDRRANRITGVFDFGDARVGDYHREFAPLYEIELPLGRDVASAYGAATGRDVALDRVAAHTVLRIVHDMVAITAAPSGHDPDKSHLWLRELAGYHPDLLAGYRAAAAMHREPSTETTTT